ncbi:MAG: thiolase domain-containing protein [Thermodesulfobacteriota bacterium]|nr:thiolase domain-containing protein [Thermodesulfobacteriota bacterium]
MRGVSIIGIGTTPFGILEGKSLKEIATIACNEAIKEAGIEKEAVEAFYLGNFISGILLGQETIAPLVANSLGLPKQVPCTKVEGACCSSGIALRQGYLLVAAGLANFVLVAGVEKMTSATTEKNTEGLASAFDQETEGQTGLTFPGFFALIARRHMHQYGTKIEHLALVSVKNHGNSTANPRARFRKKATVEEVMASRMVADPLKLYDCCSISDGAAAAVLCPSDIAHQFSRKPIDILASAHTTGFSTTYEMDDPTILMATVMAAKKAYEMARLFPQDIHVAELHDCFTIAEIVDSEDLGFFEKGKGGFAVEDGLTQVGGKIPINPSGGLISKGHPVGATGLGQVYEIVKQLRGEHENQVRNAGIGLSHNLGATGQVCTVHIFKRRG